MVNSTDRAFDAWLRSLPYERDWIRRNLTTLRQRFENDPESPVERVDPPRRARDRYEEI